MYSNRSRKIKASRQKTFCPQRESSLTFSKGYDGIDIVQILSIFIILTLVSSLIIQIPIPVHADPSDPSPQGAEIYKINWTFSESEDYNTTETKIESDDLTLKTYSDLWMESLKSDFNKGTKINVTTTEESTTSIVFQDYFNYTGEGPWEHDKLFGQNDQWQHGEAADIPAFVGPHTGTYVWGTNLIGKYVDSGGQSNDYFLRSPVINLSTSSNTELSFWHYYDFENDTLRNDGGIMEVSIDSGINWETIIPITGYDGKIVDTNNRLWDRFCFAGNSSNWVEEQFDLSKYDGEESLSFRFRFATNGDITDWGWYVDDVVITSTIISDGELELTSTPIVGGNVPTNLIQRPAKVTIIDTNNPITFSGPITKWTVWTATGGTGIMKIFRENNGEFIFVAETPEVVIGIGENTFDYRIDVEEGDYVGWYGNNSAAIYAKEGGISYFNNDTGDVKETLPIGNWTFTNFSHSISVSGLYREPTGYFTSQVFDAQSAAIWKEISWTEDTPDPSVDIVLQTRSGNSTNISHNSWSDWSPFIINPDGASVNIPPSRYIQYKATFTSNLQPYTPTLREVTISYTKYAPVGSAETEDFEPNVLVQWLDFTTVDVANGQVLEYYYSLDSGVTWDPIPVGGDLMGISILGKKIRFKIILSTADTTITPVVEEISLTYSQAQPKMGLKIEVDQKEANPGDEITIRIFYNNTGVGFAKDAIITLILDENLTYDSDNNIVRPTVEGNIIRWEYETVEPTESGNKMFRVRTFVKDRDTETTLEAHAIMNYTDLGNNFYPQEDSNGIKIKVTPSLDLVLILIILIILANILIIVIFLVHRKYKAAAEAQRKIPIDNVERGIGYLIIEDNPTKSYHLFSDLIDSGYSGLCMTRTFPGRVKSSYSFEDVSMLWLSRARDENSILPTNLGAVMRSVKDFMEENENSVILLDGLEYMIVHNDFPKVLKLVHLLNELAALNNAILIMPLNSVTLDEGKVALLKRDLKLLS
jgi:hypothetical protein